MAQPAMTRSLLSPNPASAYPIIMKMNRETGVKLETPSIEFVPHAERYGTPKRLFTIWFSSSF